MQWIKIFLVVTIVKMGLNEQDAFLEQNANEIIERTRKEINRNPKDHVSILLNQIATLADINNERIAIIEKKAQRKTSQSLLRTFIGLFALVFGYLANTTDDKTKKTVYIILTTFFGGVTGTLQLLNFKRRQLLDVILFFLFSASAVTIILVVFLGLDGGASNTLNILAGVAGLIGIVSLFWANKRQKERDQKSLVAQKRKLNERLDAAE